MRLSFRIKRLGPPPPQPRPGPHHPRPSVPRRQRRGDADGRGRPGRPLLFQLPREGGLPRCLGARRSCYCCLDQIPPTEGRGGGARAKRKTQAQTQISLKGPPKGDLGLVCALLKNLCSLLSISTKTLTQSRDARGPWPLPCRCRRSRRNTHLMRNTRAPQLTPQHWLLCHMGLY